MAENKYPFGKLPLTNFEEFKRIIVGSQIPHRVYFTEHWIDETVIKYLFEKLTSKSWIPLFSDLHSKRVEFLRGEPIRLLSSEEDKRALKNFVDFYVGMGYAYVPDNTFFNHFAYMISFKLRSTYDTALLPKGERTWADEGTGIISSWKDFESFPWKSLQVVDLEKYYSFLRKILPEGMKVMVTSSLFEQILEKLLGYTNLFYFIYDQPDLVEAIFEMVGNINYRFYQEAIQFDCVGGIFHADDLGFKSGLFLKPELVRKYILSWLKKYANLAHNENKLFCLHSCGNVFEIMDDLLDGVRVDGFHSFQDSIMPVTQFKELYGHRVGIMGGVDVDFLARSTPQEVKRYVRKVLDKCMPGGRYCLGSGNSFANFIPVENYLTMLEEGLKWENS